ncbi:MAG: 50S ribosomal protein L11 methyltransferase [Caulobacteraceae bacterium]
MGGVLTAGDDRLRFIREHLPLARSRPLPQIRLHQARPDSGLHRLAEADEAGFGSPYWAYPWAGGLALARHILDRPETVGRRVLDLGAGSGLVAIAAALAGAGEVTAADIDPYAVAALGLNAAANGAIISAICGDLTAGPPPAVDIVVVGDLFYDRALAGRVTAFLDRCLDAGIEVLVGDPGRAFLPRERLRVLARYPTPDFGEERMSCVFAFLSAAAVDP